MGQGLHKELSIGFHRGCCDTGGRTIVALVVLIACAVFIAPDLSAEAPVPTASYNPAGQNGRPDLITLERYGITIEFRPSDEKVAVRVAEICEETIPTLSSQIGLRSVRPFRVFLIPDMPAYQKRMRIRLPSWGIAFAFMENQIMLELKNLKAEKLPCKGKCCGKCRALAKRKEKLERELAKATAA